MRVGGIEQRRWASRLSPRERAGEAEPIAAGRALVATAPPAVHSAHGAAGGAAFLAQLIASRDQHPQFRERRRATPNEALVAYAAAARLSQ